MRVTVLSPDGLPIEPQTYPSLAAADDALLRWCRRFAGQGYYGAASGERIALADLPQRCKVEVKVKAAARRRR